MQLVSYLGFKGQCREAFEFYEKCLNGKILMMMSNADMPAGEACLQGNDMIMHARLQVGDGVLMGSDGPPEYFQPAQGMWVSAFPATVAEAERIFHELAEGGTVTMPIGPTFFAARFGMVTDRFGTPWMINCETND